MLKGNLSNYTARKALVMVLGVFSDPAAGLCLVLLVHVSIPSERALHACIIHMLCKAGKYHADNKLLSFCPVLPDPAATTLSSCLAQALSDFLFVRRPADCTVTESQSGGGWKGPLKIIWSDPLAQAGPPKAGCSGP